MQIVKEGLKAGDLDGVVSKRFSVDQFKSKMGEDMNIMVLAFTVDGMAPAKDLERFAETGYKEVLDADATPGTLADGKHRVFVEFARVEKVDQHIRKFLDDLKNLTNIDIFEFTYHKNVTPFEASAKNLADILPRTAIAYTQKINGMKLEETQTFFDKFQMMEFKLDNNMVEIKKRNADTLRFELHAFGNTNLIMNEVKAFRLDESAMAECMFLTKYFGPYQITKTTEDRFIFSKGGESALMSKSGW
ncbi:MAG: hypothetical protein ISQ84_05410 [Pelagibacterales bacterium]|nr:hypothetical protein [Pelagibacterales bacterium]